MQDTEYTAADELDITRHVIVTELNKQYKDDDLFASDVSQHSDPGKAEATMEPFSYKDGNLYYYGNLIFGADK
jgi:hypothetical protein